MDRYDQAPDSIRTWLTENGGGIAGSPDHRYAGTRCASGCAGFQLLDERANEWRVVAGELPAPAGGNAFFGPIALNVRGYYPGQVRDNAVAHDVTRLYLTDTTATRFGAGWQLAELGRLLFAYPPGQAAAGIYARGDGSYTVYRYQGSQTWAGPPGETGRLVERDDGDGGFYAIEYPDGSAVGFDAGGRQRYTRDVVGNKTYYGFTGSRLAWIMDPAGHWFEFSYDAAGHVVQVRVHNIVGSLATVASLGYTGERLTSLTTHAGTSGGETTAFGYHATAPGAFLTAVTDPRGQTTDFAYDSRFWTPISVVRPPFLAVRDTARYRDPLRRAAPREGWGRSTNPQERLLYPNQARGTFAGIGTPPMDVEVDRFGAPTMVRRFAPPPVSGQPFVPDDLRHIDRDSTGRVTKIVAGRDYYGSTADSVRYEYDAHGNLARLIRTTAQWPTAGIAFDTISYSYDSVTTGLPFTYQRCVRLRTMREPMGGVDSVSYGASGAGQCLPERTRGMAGDTTRFLYSLAVGHASGTRPVAIIGPTGLRQDVTYEPGSFSSPGTWNTLTSVRASDGATTRVARFDALGRADSLVDPVGVVTVLRHDWFGRVLRARTGTGANAPVTASFFGPGGVVDSVRIYGTAGTLDDGPTTAVQTTRTWYNALGWADSSRTPGGRVEHARRDRLGRPYFEYRGNGAFVTRLYDFQGRLATEVLSQVRPGYTVDGRPFADAATTSVYNSFGLTSPTTLNAGEWHQYGYDERGRLITMYDSSVTTQRTYSPGGALTWESVTFADGARVTRTFEYNRRGQRTAVTDTARTTPAGAFLGAHRITYSWNGGTARLEGLSGYRDGAAYVTVGLGYDGAGRETSRAVNLLGSGGALTTATAYDAADRIGTSTTTSAQGTWYSFNGTWGGSGWYGLNDALRRFSFSEPGPSGGPAYNVMGAMAFLYDSLGGTGRLIASGKNAAGSDNNLANYSWTYDVLGNRLREACTSFYVGTCAASPDTTTFGADNAIARRWQLGSNEVHRYWHDGAGNRLAQTDSTGSVYTGPSALLSYTARSQLYFSMTPTAQVGTYDYNWHWYNGAGLRVITHAQQGGTWVPGTGPEAAQNRYYSVYDGADVSLVLARASGQWRVHQRLVTGGVDRPLAGWFSNSTGTGSQALAFVTDFQGSVRASVKADGSREDAASAWARNAFGALEGASGAGGSVNPQAGYTGASTPNATGGFTYLRNRWYDPATGRFLTQDPIGLAGGVNLYAYAGNNPVAFDDPFGLCPEIISCIVVGAAVGAFVAATVNAIANIRNGDEPTQGYGAAMAVGAATGATAAGLSYSIGAMSGGASATVAPSVEATLQPKVGSAGGPGAGRRFPAFVQSAAREESGNRCVFCLQRTIRSSTPAPNRSNIDHAIPRSRGGNNTLPNAQNTCQACNLDKRDRTTIEYLNGTP